MNPEGERGLDAFAGGIIGRLRADRVSCSLCAMRSELRAYLITHRQHPVTISFYLLLGFTAETQSMSDRMRINQRQSDV